MLNINKYIETKITEINIEYSEAVKFMQNRVDEIMNEKGPVFVAIKVEAEVENLPIGLRERRQTRNRTQTITDLRQELGIS